MSIVQEKMYMDVDDVCAILGVSKAYVDQHIIICHFQKNT